MCNTVSAPKNNEKAHQNNNLFIVEHGAAALLLLSRTETGNARLNSSKVECERYSLFYKVLLKLPHHHLEFNRLLFCSCEQLLRFFCALHCGTL